MFWIDRKKMDMTTKLKNSKSTLGKKNIDLSKVFKSTIWNLIDQVGEFTVYEMSHWNNNVDRWLRNRSYLNQKDYKRGEILFIDLGAHNFKYEPSFSHPCIVLQQRTRSILIVPCSTKKFGKGYREIINAYAPLNKDGFTQNTGIQIEDFRWVSKNRVISKVGKTSSRVLNEIDKRLLELIPTYKKKSVKFKGESKKNIDLTNENNELKNKISSLENQIKNLNEQICVLKSKKE